MASLKASRLRAPSQGIRSFFEPKSIAVVGASTDSAKLASIIYSNLLENREKGVLKAPVYPVNPSHSSIGRNRCYPDVRSLPEVPELVVVAVPATLAVRLVGESAREGAKAAILISGGFAEAGRNDLEGEMLAAARAHGMRLLGPNTIGLVDKYSGVDTLFLKPTKRLGSGREVVSMLRPRRGGVAVISQSGHLGEVISEELAANHVGLRALVGTGNQLDVSVEDLIGHFGGDSRCSVIAVYLEGARDGRRFIREASRAAAAKPVIVFKLGKTKAGANAALTHTASLVGDLELYRAAFSKAGVVEADSLQSLVDYSVAFALLKPPAGRRLLVTTNAGGVGAIAADEAGRLGLRVPPLDWTARDAVKRCLTGLPLLSALKLGNPLDLTATVPTGPYVEATAAALASPGFDSAVVLPTHQTPAVDPDIAERMGAALKASGKPSCVSVMGRSPLAQMIQDGFLERGIPSFPTPERAVRALAALSSYSDSKPATVAAASEGTADRVSYLPKREGPLPPKVLEMLMSDYGIPSPRSVLVSPGGDAAEAGGLTFPVVCKLISRSLVHKSDRGGVILGIDDESGVASAVAKLRGLAAQLGVEWEGVLVQEMADQGVEVLLGSTRDPTFGPALAIGGGGKYAEVVRDTAVAIAPVGRREARRLILSTRLGRVLEGYRGEARGDITGLSRVVSDFSRILFENPSIGQVEVNPLIVSAKGVTAVDVRAVASGRRQASAPAAGIRGDIDAHP